MTEGIIPDCSTSGCWTVLGKSRCCDFQQGNYIVLYPGELEEAEAKGISTGHLEITDDNYNGGKKAVCKAQCTASCDNGLKPFDCKAYPFFPVIDKDGSMDLLIKGKKCPLQAEHLRGHADYVFDMWTEIFLFHPEAYEWLQNVKMVGYTEPFRLGEKKLQIA